MEYDFGFRPESYGLLTSEPSPSRVKGTVRRRIISATSELGRRIDELPAAQESLSAEGLDTWGRIHPAFMGGEYLPDLAADEVEIARVDLASTTGDAISVRARRDGAEIQYRVVDEYGTQYEVDPERSDRPLSFGELVHLIDTARGGGEGAAYPDDPSVMGLTDVWRDYNLDDDPDPSRIDELIDFVRVTSEFYEQLTPFYQERGREWADRVKRRPST